MQEIQKKIELLQNLFRGRTDIFAKFWEKDGKSGFMTALDLDWEKFRLHREKGGTLASFKPKKKLPLTEEIWKQHLSGQLELAIYPLLPEQTCHFLVMFLEKKNLNHDTRRMLVLTKNLGLEAYLQNNRKEEGIWVWIFFEKAWEAQKARQLATLLLKKTLKIINLERKIENIWPSRVDLEENSPPKSIPVPLTATGLRSKTNIFLEEKNLQPASDQWLFLAQIRQNSLESLEIALQKLILIEQREKASLEQNLADNLAQITETRSEIKKAEKNSLKKPKKATKNGTKTLDFQENLKEENLSQELLKIEKTKENSKNSENYFKSNSETSLEKEKNPSANLPEKISENFTNSKDTEDSLPLILQEKLLISKTNLSPQILAFIRQSLLIPNEQFTVLKRIGKSTFGVKKNFDLLEENSQFVLAPRGFLPELKLFCQKIGQNLILQDRRLYLEKVDFSSQVKLRPYQEQALLEVEKFDSGLLVAPPGSGKTVMGLELIARKKQNSLILVHRKELLDQWLERAQSFLGLEKSEVGILGSGKKSSSPRLTIGMLQTLGKMDLSELKGTFGLLLVDECHHIPAQTFRQVVEQFNPRFLYGLTATPKRKYNDEKLIFLQIGPILTTVYPEGESGEERALPRLILRETELFFPFDMLQDQAELLSKVLVFDSQRNRQITSDVLMEVKNGRSILILTERKEHTEVLAKYLEKHCQVLTITGNDSKSARREKIKQVRAGEFEVLIATGQLFGEGVDISNLECLFLVYPFSFEGKLIQYIGRIQRSLREQLIYDYRDKEIAYLEKLFAKRWQYYKENVSV